jgi:hypothetical protein
MAEANFSIIDEINSVKTVLLTDLKKMHSNFSFIIDPSVPQKVRASRSSFRQILWNLASGGVYSTNFLLGVVISKSYYKLF